MTMLRRMASRIDTLTVHASLPVDYTPALRVSVHAELDLARRDTTAALRDFAAVPDSICMFDGCFDGES